MPWDERDDRRKTQRVAASDAVMAERHRGFNLSAKDNHAKYERPHFAVIGEGTKTAIARYQVGYAQIDWSK